MSASEPRGKTLTGEIGLKKCNFSLVLFPQIVQRVLAALVFTENLFRRMGAVIGRERYEYVVEDKA